MDLKSKSYQNSDQIYDLCEASNSTRELAKCHEDTRFSKGDSENNFNISSSITSKNKKQEVSREGNGIDVSGWKSQFCMNGISFCFKVGSLILECVSSFLHVIHGLLVYGDARVGNLGNHCTTRNIEVSFTTIIIT